MSGMKLHIILLSLIQNLKKMKKHILIVSCLLSTIFYACQQDTKDGGSDSLEVAADSSMNRKEMLSQKIKSEIDRIDNGILQYDTMIGDGSEELDEKTIKSYQNAKYDLIHLKEKLSAKLNQLEMASEETLDTIESELTTETASIDGELETLGKKVQAIIDEVQKPA